MKKVLFVSLLPTMCAFMAQAATISGWGSKNNDSVSAAWGTTALGYTIKDVDIEDEYVETGLCTVNQSTASETCKNKTDAQECGYVDSNGCIYDVDQIVNRKDYQLELVTDTLFREVLDTLEKEAQAQYNAKLTAEQNMCVSANNGGIIGRNEMTGTYNWVKLKKRKIDSSYAAKGLGTGDFVHSNDLYGSFCAARITLQSDDPDIQEAIRSGTKWATTYFAVGDVFTCGSWIPQSDLQSIAENIANRNLKNAGKDSTDLTTSQKWWLAGATVLGGGIGVAGSELLQTKTGLGQWMGSQNRSSDLSNTEKQELASSLSAAELGYERDCNGSVEETTKFSRQVKNYVGDTQLYTFSVSTSGTGTYTCKDLSSYIDALKRKQDLRDDGSERKGRGLRVGMDGLLGLAGGIAAYRATADTMKARNQEEYDEAKRQEVETFMSNVGSHIFCFIGSEEAGTFGDLVEVSME